MGAVRTEAYREAQEAQPNQSKVRHFHRLFGYFVSNVPTIPDRKTRLVRDDLLAEEVRELSDELYATQPDIEKIAHEAADVMYILYGLAVECGFDLDQVFHYVHLSNMTKDKPEGPGHKTPKGARFVSADAAIKEYFGA